MTASNFSIIKTEKAPIPIKSLLHIIEDTLARGIGEEFYLEIYERAEPYNDGNRVTIKLDFKVPQAAAPEPSEE